jgi:hypothetical protein
MTITQYLFNPSASMTVLIRGVAGDKITGRVAGVAEVALTVGAPE